MQSAAKLTRSYPNPWRRRGRNDAGVASAREPGSLFGTVERKLFAIDCAQLNHSVLLLLSFVVDLGDIRHPRGRSVKAVDGTSQAYRSGAVTRDPTDACSWSTCSCDAPASGSEQLKEQ